MVPHVVEIWCQVVASSPAVSRHFHEHVGLSIVAHTNVPCSLASFGCQELLSRHVLQSTAEYRDVLWIACSNGNGELRSGWFSSQWRWCSPHSWRKKVGAHHTERDTLNDLQCLWFIRQDHDTLGQHRPVHWLVSHDDFSAPHDYHDLQVAQQRSLVSLRSVVCILECKGLKSQWQPCLLFWNSDSIFWNGRHAMVLGNKQCAWGCWTCWCRGFWDPFVIHSCLGMILVAGDAAGGMFGRSPYLETGQHLAFSRGMTTFDNLHAAEMI